MPDIQDTFRSVGWAVTFAIVGACVGIFLVMASTMVLPWLMNKITPDVDEAKEIIRGNRAVAEYHGRVCAAAILGVSIVVAAAILGGLISALH